MTNKLWIAFILSSSFAVSLHVPLTCDDLESSSIFTLSYAGSHDLLDFSDHTPGFGALRYRQFSDWNFREPLFSDVLSLSIDGSVASLSNFSWRPDYVEQTIETTMQTKLAGKVISSELGNLSPGYLLFLGFSFNLKFRVRCKSDIWIHSTLLGAFCTNQLHPRCKRSISPDRFPSM
jgi:hypothetical protein